MTDVAPVPSQRSAVLEEHFRLRDADSSEDPRDLVDDAELPAATESPDALTGRPHDAWEHAWVERLRRPADGQEPKIADTNNFWNYFRPQTVKDLRKLLALRAREKRDWTNDYGEEEFVPEHRLGTFEARLFAWITSGTLDAAMQRFGTRRMERLLNDIGMLEILWADADVSKLAGAEEFKRSVSRECGALLAELAIVMYDLGVPANAIFG